MTNQARPVPWMVPVLVEAIEGLLRADRVSESDRETDRRYAREALAAYHKEAKADGIEALPVEEFRKLGYLHEVNRKFFHPLGLALEVAQAPDGSEALGRIWDYRGDPEGVHYADDLLRADAVTYVREQWQTRLVGRKNGLGFMVQPVPGAAAGTETT